MKMHILLGLSFVLLLSGCNVESSSGNSGSKGLADQVETNVAASANGAVATSAYNPDDAMKLIDEDDTTWWASNPGEPIIVEFAEVEDIVSLKLTRTESSAPTGTNPAILIELSEDGITYAKSNVSIVIGGVACSSMSTSSTSMSCTLAEARATKFVRITSSNNSYELRELEVIAMR
ncbi:hypothetical protein E4656_10355 [Natronospirillum operosum]|uniref:F5/8 type C domain-containing protein n=1 Tax=Natronospirillum operosum TaxID=2759953 RepID=A0A4Z0WES9_9GAMM|nr:hypothetical protein [Natronospirillum operosum]TGG93441.1 hypothetical protein E4656_10355 [Natronospirillum operosum]